MTDRMRCTSSHSFISELEVMEEAENYNSWIFETIRPHLGSSILEVGCGIGTFTEKLLTTGARVTSIDIDERCLSYTARRLKSERLELHCMPAREAVTLKGDYDTVLMLNVLEHIEDDAELLQTLRTELSGRLVLLVPAFTFLYGKTDELVGHYRRYSKKNLVELVRECGYTKVRCHYFNSVGFFAWFLMNRIIRQETNTVGRVKFYDEKVVPLVSRMESIIHPPLGQSLFLTASA